jgi:hypothetical protein
VSIRGQVIALERSIIVDRMREVAERLSSLARLIDATESATVRMEYAGAECRRLRNRLLEVSR